MSRTPQFSWPLRVLPGLGEELAEVLALYDYRLTGEDVCTELTRSEWERGPEGHLATVTLRNLWEAGEFFFGPCSPLVYNYGRIGLREEMGAMRLSHAARRRARQHMPCDRQP
jgi:hypothetical protein